MERSPRLSTIRRHRCRRDFKPRTIIFLCTEILPVSLDDSFLSMAKTAKNLGHRVVIVTTHCDQKLIDTEFESMEVYQVGSYIPKLLGGYFYRLLYFLRTIYSTTWLILKKRKIQPAFVVVPTYDSLVIPILKHLSRLRIVQIQTFPELEIFGVSPEDILANKAPIFDKYCAKLADEVIVQSQFSASIFQELFSIPKKPLGILYPCVDSTIFEKCPLVRINRIVRAPKEAVTFVCFAPIIPSSNLELIIRAFAMLLDQIKYRDRFKYLTLYLVIAGYYEESKDFEDYSTTIQFIALGLCGRTPRVIFLNGTPVKYRKSLLYNCIGVLFPMKHSIDGRTILEAGLMKRPVLATRSDIALELIQDGVNGFILDDTPLAFYKCMSTLFHSKHGTRCERSKKILTHFRKNFSPQRYSSEVENIVLRNSSHVDRENKFYSSV